MVTASSPARIAARALRSPLSAVLGWALLLVAAWVSATDDGQWVFKLDSFVYYYAVEQWHDGGGLYTWYANPAQQLWPFTYPPLAAWLLTPLNLLSYEWATALLLAATPLCAGLTAWALLRALQGRGAARASVAAAEPDSLRSSPPSSQPSSSPLPPSPPPPTPPSWPLDPALARGLAPWLALVGTMVLEPLPKTMEYAQVNAILMALVAIDLLAVPARSPWRGALSGLAAAIKLTPAIAVLVLLARGEWRAAATMVGSAVGLTLMAALASPAETWQFFTWAMWDSGRAGFADYSGNQNIKGAVARGLPESLWTPAWALCIALALGAAWLLCRRLDSLRPTAALPDDAGAPAIDEGLILALQLSVVMILGLLISPISWSHHWVWALPALTALAAASRRWRSRPLGAITAAGALVFLLAMQWWFPEQNHVEQHWPLWAKALGSSYTWWSMAAGLALWRAAGQQTHRRRHRTSLRADLHAHPGPGRATQPGSGSSRPPSSPQRPHQP